MSYDKISLTFSPYFLSYNHPIVPSITDYPVYIYIYISTIKILIQSHFRPRARRTKTVAVTYTRSLHDRIGRGGPVFQRKGTRAKRGRTYGGVVRLVYKESCLFLAHGYREKTICLRDLEHFANLSATSRLESLTSRVTQKARRAMVLTERHLRKSNTRSK